MNLITATVLGLALLSVGCAKEKKASSSSNVPFVDTTGGPYTPPTNGPGQGSGNNVFGGVAPLSIVSTDVMGQYTKRPMNNPSNIQINVNLVKTGVNEAGHSMFGGTVSISYTENGYSYQGYFTSGTTAQSTKYNLWATFSGKKGFHGFFEDFMGGLIVVIDETVDLGDGGGLQDSVNGKVYFKNFGPTAIGAVHPPTYCWFISASGSPWDCRSWPSNDEVNTYAALLPNNGYIQLGSFTGLSLAKAFNGVKIQ